METTRATTTASNNTVTEYGPRPAPGRQLTCWLPAGRLRLGKAAADAHQKAVANLAIGGQFLLAAAFGRGGIGRRPIFDVGRNRMRQLQRLVMCLGRQGDDEVEIEPLPVLELGEGHRL